MDQFQTHYQNLQVTENASPEVIKGAYRYLAQKWHPDKNPTEREKAEKVSRLINQAYAVLSDPERRREHDDWIKSKRKSQGTSEKREAKQETSSRKAVRVSVLSGASTFEEWKKLPVGQEHPKRPTFSGICLSCEESATFHFKEIGLGAALGRLSLGVLTHGWQSVAAIARSSSLEQVAEDVNCSKCNAEHMVCMKCLLLQETNGLHNLCVGCLGYLCD